MRLFSVIHRLRVSLITIELENWSKKLKGERRAPFRPKRRTVDDNERRHADPVDFAS